jgi:hypothetical protein
MLFTEDDFYEAAHAAANEVGSAVANIRVYGFRADVEFFSRSGKSTWHAYVSVDPVTRHFSRGLSGYPDATAFRTFVDELDANLP